MTADFNARARKGITAIENHTPGATDRIDLDTLDLYSLSHCALTQALGRGSFHRGCDLLGITTLDNVTAPYGFSIMPDEEITDHDGNYAALRRAWITELTLHRTAKAAIVAD